MTITAADPVEIEPATSKSELVRPREIGSDFHWAGLPQGPFLPWPRPHAWFGLGRHTVLALWRQQGWWDRTLHVPDYFCPRTTSHFEQAGIRVRPYADHPGRPHPVWNTLQPASDNVVLAVNYFGVRDVEVWRAWRRAHPAVIFIEDHTHDPFSSWAVASDADYALASVRKTLPVTEGGLLWSPRGHSLPAEPVEINWSAGALKLAAMLWKAEYLAGSSAADNETFRRWYAEGEQRLSVEGDVFGLPPWTRAFLSEGAPAAWRCQREANVRAMLELIYGLPGIRPLFRTWPAGHCPLNVVLEFATEGLCRRCHEECAALGIYSAGHWPLLPSASAESAALSRRLRTFPVDHRYGFGDLQRVAQALRRLS